MNKKEDLRILKTRASLYRGLLELMETKPFEDIKISEICDVSLINRSTFYDHFSDKYELLYSYMNSMRKEFIDGLHFDSNITDLKKYHLYVLKDFLQYVDKKKVIYSKILKINYNSIAKEMMKNALLESFEQEINSHYKNLSVIPTRTLVLFYFSGIINVIMDALQDLSTFNVDQLYQQFIVLIPSFDQLIYNQ